MAGRPGAAPGKLSFGDSVAQAGARPTNIATRLGLCFRLTRAGRNTNCCAGKEVEERRISLLIHFETRSSDSPLVDQVWRSRSERPGTFHSIAESRWEIVVTRLFGRSLVIVRGPESK